VDGKQASMPPHGVEHHYAPLGIVEATAASPFINFVDDCICRFAPLSCLEMLKKI
jgi:hypothetical protein